MVAVMQRVINFSGGKTSAYMTILEYKQGDIVLFCDTGREHPKTYKFINDFEAFENIPNRTKRECTIQLKIKTAKRYLRSIGIRTFENLVGFRADEPLRVKRRNNPYKNVHDKFPLYEKGITKEWINDYWSKKPYNLEIPSILGNCDLCFMKGKNAIISILTLYPELADKWIEDEERETNIFKKTYLHNISMRQLRNIAKNNLFKEYELENISPAFNCACTT